jgi:hypothetical protein
MTFRSSLSGKNYSRDELLDFFSALAGVYAIQDPVKALEDKIKRKSWSEGVILAEALLESIGKTKLRVHFQSRLDDLSIIDHLSAEKTAMFLFGLGIIDQPNYSRMVEVYQKKEELVRQIRGQYRLKPEEAEHMIRKAIECLVALKGTKPKV